jgi:hypothetical protein
MCDIQNVTLTERSAHEAERKRLYEKQHPETRVGGAL